jgi:hypothetical protein
MPQRLVYAPRAYVYTKKADGTILDLSNYVTEGTVDRKINQVSTASVTLRNPYRVFTKPSKGAAFHPQDPITIYLERIAGYPVRVFTGYLDETPYYQLYPGTISLSASCTLKRLLYSYFDPSLPYMIAFFEKYGWINTGSGSLISSQSFNAKQMTTQADVNAGTKPFTDLQDGSLGKLLWAVLYNIAQWNDTNIYIEALPSGANGIAARMATLMQSLQQEQQQASAEFNTFLEAVVGTGSQGSGGGAGNTGTTSLTGGTTNQKIWNFLIQKGCTPAGAAAVIGNWGVEAPNGPGEAQGGGTAIPSIASGLGYGLAQWGGSRLAALIQYAQSQNKPPSNLAIQLNFFWTEINNGSYAEALQAITTSTSVSSATTTFCDIYEAPGTPNLATRIQLANQALQDYGSGSGSSNTGSTSTENNSSASSSGTVNTALNTSGNQMTRIQAMLDAAQAIANSKLPYAWGGGHAKAGTPSQGGNSDGGNGATVTGFDCSGTVGAVLAAAGLITYGGPVDVSNLLPGQANAQDGPGQGAPEVTLYANPAHIFMTINGRAFGTAGGTTATPTGGADWIPGGTGDVSAFSAYHFPMSVLNQTVTYNAPNVTGNSSGAPSSGGGNTSAQAFVAELQFPSVEDQVTAIALGAEGKGLMHDQQLMPFVQQLTQASMRSFQSLPNGDFYAFYPDYFGEMGQHQPYWLIDDIEILDGGINLNDNGLSTHVYAIGDNTWPVNNELMNMLFSAGTITVYNAFLGNLVDTQAGGSRKATQTSKHDKKTSPATTVTDPGQNLSGNIMKADEAAKFVERYGARPLVQNYPMVRSAIYEMLLAYQQFMTAWSTQFDTPFTFTFMPEVFPGGKVAFPNHGLQMYVQEVVHSWNYAEGGFTTTATLSAPSVYGNTNEDLPPNMVDALVEPIRQQPPGSTGLKTTNPAANTSGSSKQQQQQTAQQTVPSDTPTGEPIGIANPLGPIIRNIHSPFGVL